MSYLGKTPVDVVDALNVQSLTVDNNLTVDTDTLVVDSTNNRVGVGTSLPSTNLHVSSSGDTLLRVTSADGNGAFLDLGDASDPDGGRIVYDSGSNLTFSTASTERLRIESDGDLQHLSKPAYFARAWVNFNGTGTVSIRANGNVSSITDYGTGYYGVNFSTAMIDANYAPVAMGKSTTSSYGQSFTTNTHQSHTQTTSQVRIVNSYQDDNSNGVTYVDSAYMFVAVYR